MSKTMSIKDLLQENMIQILSYLRAVDLATTKEVNKSIFSEVVISIAVDCIIKEVYSILPIPVSKGDIIFSRTTQQRPDYLYTREISSLLYALSAPQPTTGKGFWISSSWVSNAKKYFDALTLPEIIDITQYRKPSGKKGLKQSKIRQRRGSDCLPPWPSMNADIVCTHGSLSLTKMPRAKRRTIDTRIWYFLRRFYPEGKEFRCSRDIECIICANDNEEAKANANEKRVAVITERRNDLIPISLNALSQRKCGVPIDSITTRVAFNNDMIINTSPYQSPMSPSDSFEDLYISFESDPYYNFANTGNLEDSLNKQQAAIGLDFLQPLVPGLYNIVPKKWLQSWRRYTKDITLTSLPHLDCSSLLCQSHGMLVIPPHLEEYLIGMRRSLLGGLGGYSGEIIEIISADEWDDLQNVIHGTGDSSIRFCLDGSGISWNASVCIVCDPFNYNSFVIGNNSKPSRNAQPFTGLVVA